jgi:hypothetical protein
MHDKDEKIFNVKMHLKEYSEGVDQIHLANEPSDSIATRFSR